nr:MAG TPA: mRNA interferase EndoA [Caudoviricetes sp.]
MSNRPSHYNTRKKPRIREITFYLDCKTLDKLETVANWDNQTRSRIVERAIRFYFLKQKKDIYEAYKKSKICYKKKSIKK